MFYK
jgi:hypothetical protein